MDYSHIHIVGIGGTLRPQSRSLLALQRALDAVAATGAKSTLLDLNQVQLPMFVPKIPLEKWGENVQDFVRQMAQADGLILSTAAYHGSMAGVTKNAIDFSEYLADDAKPYWHQKAVGLIAVAGGVNAAPNVVTAMTHCVHALRGNTIPLYAAIKESKKVFDREGNIIDETWAKRLDQIGIMVTELAFRLKMPLAVKAVKRQAQ